MMKEYEGISDEELILGAQNGEKKLEEFLIDKYKGMVRKKAHAMFLIGGEQEDLIQEGMIGLFRAVRDYRPDKNASFATFANLCVERQIYKAIEISGRQKHRPLNSYISLSEENSPLKNAEDTKQQNPEEIIIDRENADLMLEKIRKSSVLLKIRFWSFIWRDWITTRLPGRWKNLQNLLITLFKEYGTRSIS